MQQYVEQHIPADYFGGYLHPYLLRGRLHAHLFRGRADGDLVVCSYLDRWCRERSAAPCLIVPSLTSTEVDPLEAPRTISPGAPMTFAYIGPGIRRDCVGQMVRAAALLKSRSVLFRMVLTGLTPAAELRARSLVTAAGVSAEVVVSGWQDERVIRPLWRDASVFMMLRTNDRSSWACFPGRIGDYVLHGKALILSDVGDFPAYFTHRQSAMLVPPEDPVRLADVMTELILHPTLATDIGARAGDLAATTFDYRWQGQRLKRWLDEEIVPRTAKPL